MYKFLAIPKKSYGSPIIIDSIQSTHLQQKKLHDNILNPSNTLTQIKNAKLNNQSVYNEPALSKQAQDRF